MDDEQMLFEAWARDQCVLHRQHTGRYSSTITQFAWEAWQEHAGIVSELRARNAELEAQLAESRANDRTAMGYLSDIRKIVGGDDFPQMVQRIAELEAQLVKRNAQMRKIGKALNPMARSLLWDDIARGAVERIAELEAKQVPEGWIPIETAPKMEAILI